MSIIIMTLCYWICGSLFQSVCISLSVCVCAVSESESGEGRLEDLHRRRNLLSAYCKLIVHSVLEMSMAAEVFKQYVKVWHFSSWLYSLTLNSGNLLTRQKSRAVNQMFFRSVVFFVNIRSPDNTAHIYRKYQGSKEMWDF